MRAPDFQNVASKGAPLSSPKSLAPSGKNCCASPDLFLSPTFTNSPQISQPITITISTAVVKREPPLRRYSYWIALTNSYDQYHPKALEVSSALGNCRLFTTDAVLTEFLNALADKGPLIRAAAIREGLINSCFHSEICSWGDPQGEFGGQPLFREPFGGAPPLSDGPLPAAGHMFPTFPPRAAVVPRTDSPSHS